MKKFLALLSTLLLAGSMVACSSAPASSADPTPAPTPEVTPAPVVDVATSELYDAAMTAVFEDKAEEMKGYLPEIPADFLEQMTGLTSDLMAEYTAVMPMMSQGAQNVVIIVKATEGKATDVETALNTYLENEVKAKDPAQGGMSYPGELERISAAQILVQGDYVCFLSFDTDSLTEGADRITELEGINAKAVDAVKALLG